MAMLARDRSLSPPVAKQFLIYPMLDDSKVKQQPALEAVAMWSIERNITAWSAYLRADFGTDRVSPCAAPIRATSVEGLPPTYMDTGTLDLYRDEILRHTSRIAAAHIETELHVLLGLPHVYDLFAPFCGPSKRAMEGRMRQIRKL
ncbi:hypothetical protein N7532_008445 [Penicillium argentinense]|uniref:Alpha/beta hydrolase fold-3 domain-containing protein n=1 Tax=Penicillium argentinense TaxID=1131581 RepID=A0A9W9K212_9EURO|nr:uncharacterized protein N7532_008445 [Penicillium argentinense]KAJ5089761.1 hypothetical protein N7532_008445 [Penicillium argentinense]